MRRLLQALSAVMPFVIIGGLLYAGIFVKPKSIGASVKPPALSERDVFYGVAVTNETVIWAVGRNGKIVRSDDKGQSWMQQASNGNAHLQSIAAWDAMRALAVGNNGVVLVTADAGKTWQPATTVPSNAEQQKYIRVRTGPDGRAWIVGEFGLIVESRDFGANWKSLGRQEDVAWNDIAVGGDAILTVGEFGRIGRSTDGGASWTEVDSPVKSSLMAVSLRADGTAVAVGLEGAILLSRDQGASWRQVQSGTAEHLFSVSTRNGGWMAVGNQGIYLVADAQATDWKLGHLPDRVYAWHTDIQTSAGDAYLAGETLSLLTADGRFIQFK